MKGNIRKIVVGDSYELSIKYVKGVRYRVGDKSCTITDFVLNGDPEDFTSIDVYVEDGTSTFIWKTIYSRPLDIEYDVNFS